jgi:hypothetical protein
MRPTAGKYHIGAYCMTSGTENSEENVECWLLRLRETL